MSTDCITGSTDGIGLAAARMLLADGHRVFVRARREEPGLQSEELQRDVLARLDGFVDPIVR